MKALATYLSGFATIGVLIFLQTDLLLQTVLIALLSVLLLAIEWSVGRVMIYIFTLALATTGEILMVQMGIWSYPVESAFGIPFWIPFVWVNFAFFFIQLKQSVDTFVSKSSS